MNKVHSFYDKQTGLFLGRTFSGPEGSLENNIPEGAGAIEGVFDHNCHRVDLESGNVVHYVPPQPSLDHFWTGKRWELKPEIVEENNVRLMTKATIVDLESKQHRAVREFILAESPAEAAQAKARVRELENQMSLHREGFRARFKRSL